jgi:hypothetical protein
VEQAHAEMLFQLPHRLADRLRRQAGIHRRLAESFGAHHADEQTDDRALSMIFTTKSENQTAFLWLV